MATVNINNADAEQFHEQEKHLREITKLFSEAGVAAHDLNEEEKKLLGYTKELEQSLQNVVKAMVLRNKVETSTRELEQQIHDIRKRIVEHSKNHNELVNETRRSLDEQLRKEKESLQNADQQLGIYRDLNGQIIANVYSNDGLIKKQKEANREYISASDHLRALLGQQLNLEQQLTRNPDSTNLKRQLDNLRLQVREARLIKQDYKDNDKYLTDQIKKQKDIIDLSEKNIIHLQKAREVNDTILSTLNEQYKALNRQKQIKAWDELLTSKYSMLASLLGLNQLISLLFAADKQVIDLISNLGLTREIGQDIRKNWTEFVTEIKDGSISVSDMFEAQSNLNEGLGISVLHNKENLKTYNDITKLMGVSINSANKLNILSAVLGKTQKEYTLNVIKASHEAQVLTKTSFSVKDILQTIGELSAGILIKFKGNPEELGKAVVEAKKLGLTLSQVDNIGESLLNWHSSIENELKAELLTSRELNLERARAAALTGQQRDLMAEISKQVGSYKDFTKLNILAQKSLAEAFGLGRDEMADMLLKQEMLIAYGTKAEHLTTAQLEEQKKSGLTMDEYLYKQQAAVTLQEKLNNSLDKLKQILVNLVEGPFGRILNVISNILGKTGVISTLFVGISALMGGQMLRSLVGLARSMSALLALTRLEAYFATLSTSMKTLGIGAAIGLAAASAAAFAASSQAEKSASTVQKIEDGVALSNRGPFTITDNYGATAITKKGDNIAVSPNINKGTQNDYRALEEKLEKLININERQYDVQRQGQKIYMNEFALGKVSILATNKENPRNFY